MYVCLQNFTAAKHGQQPDNSVSNNNSNDNNNNHIYIVPYM